MRSGLNEENGTGARGQGKSSKILIILVRVLWRGLDLGENEIRVVCPNPRQAVSLDKELSKIGVMVK